MSRLETLRCELETNRTATVNKSVEIYLEKTFGHSADLALLGEADKPVAPTAWSVAATAATSHVDDRFKQAVAQQLAKDDLGRFERKCLEAFSSATTLVLNVVSSKLSGGGSLTFNVPNPIAPAIGALVGGLLGGVAFARLSDVLLWRPGLEFSRDPLMLVLGAALGGAATAWALSLLSWDNRLRKNVEWLLIGWGAAEVTGIVAGKILDHAFGNAFSLSGINEVWRNISPLLVKASSDGATQGTATLSALGSAVGNAPQAAKTDEESKKLPIKRWLVLALIFLMVRLVKPRAVSSAAVTREFARTVLDTGYDLSVRLAGALDNLESSGFSVGVIPHSLV